MSAFNNVSDGEPEWSPPGLPARKTRHAPPRAAARKTRAQRGAQSASSSGRSSTSGGSRKRGREEGHGDTNRRPAPANRSGMATENSAALERVDAERVNATSGEGDPPLTAAETSGASAEAAHSMAADHATGSHEAHHFLQRFATIYDTPGISLRSAILLKLEMSALLYSYGRGGVTYERLRILYTKIALALNEAGSIVPPFFNPQLAPNGLVRDGYSRVLIELLHVMILALEIHDEVKIPNDYLSKACYAIQNVIMEDSGLPMYRL